MFRPPDCWIKKSSMMFSDYLWYMTSVDIAKDDPIWSDDMSIRVNGTGHILHAYVNGEYLGLEWATYDIYNYVFEKKVKLNQGSNQITLLSATIDFAVHWDT